MTLLTNFLPKYYQPILIPILVNQTLHTIRATLENLLGRK